MQSYGAIQMDIKIKGITEEIYLQYANTTKEDIVSHMKEEALTCRFPYQ